MSGAALFVLFRGGHNTRLETKSCQTIVVGFWSNENLPSFYAPGDSEEEKIISLLQKLCHLSFSPHSPQEEEEEEKTKTLF